MKPVVNAQVDIEKVVAALEKPQPTLVRSLLLSLLTKKTVRKLEG